MSNATQPPVAPNWYGISPLISVYPMYHQLDLIEDQLMMYRTRSILISPEGNTMAEAGFAPAVEQPTAAEVRAQQQIAREQPAATIPETIDITLSRITDHLTEQVRQNFSGRLLEYFLPRDARAGVVRNELQTFMVSEFLGDLAGLSDAFKVRTEEQIASLLSMQPVYNALHERHSRTIRDAVSEKLTDQLDPIIDGLMTEAVERINDVTGTPAEKINGCMRNQALYLTFIDMTVRRILAKLATWSPPSSIIFETKSVEEPCFDGVKVMVMWDGGRAARTNPTMQNGQYLVMQQFPWLGRTSMIMPEDADQATRALVEGRRRLYVKALIAMVSPLVNRDNAR